MTQIIETPFSASALIDYAFAEVLRMRKSVQQILSCGSLVILLTLGGCFLQPAHSVVGDPVVSADDDDVDDDDDGDGVANQDDAFPNDPNEWADTDGDGVGDNADDCPDFDDALCEHGSCGGGSACICLDGWGGDGCDQCRVGYFGSGCTACTCVNGVCRDGADGDGTCTSCTAHWTGTNCDTCTTGWAGADCSACALGYFGADCSPCLCEHGECDDGIDGDGHCVEPCTTGWTGTDCEICAADFYTAACLPCLCKNGVCSDGTSGTGECLGECNTGATGSSCENCVAGYFGPNCAPCTCEHGDCKDGVEGDGTCSSCETGWRGDNCNSCAADFFGATCVPCSCLNGICDGGYSGSGLCRFCNDGWTGSLCDIPDADNDGIADVEDPFPNDPLIPKAAEKGLVYAHTAGTLYTMNPSDYSVNAVGAFTFDVGGPYAVTDLALDQNATLFVVSFTKLFVCDPDTAACYLLAELPESFNAMTLVPPGTVHPERDTLVVIANSGNWYEVTFENAAASLTSLGAYGTGYASSGDAFSIAGFGTFAAVAKSGATEDFIIEVDPTTGHMLREIAGLDNGTASYTNVYGLAGWYDPDSDTEKIFAFDETGVIIEIDPTTGTWSVVVSTGFSWWGAGVITVAG